MQVSRFLHHQAGIRALRRCRRRDRFRFDTLCQLNRHSRLLDTADVALSPTGRRPWLVGHGPPGFHPDAPLPIKTTGVLQDHAQVDFGEDVLGVSFVCRMSAVRELLRRSRNRAPDSKRLRLGWTIHKLDNEWQLGR